MFNFRDPNFICTHGAAIPESTTALASGYDLRAKGYMDIDTKETVWFDEYDGNQSVVIKAGKRILIKTGLQIQLPNPAIISDHVCQEKGKFILEAQVRARSGLSLKNGIEVLNSPGTIDADYQGDIGAILHNTSDVDFVINADDRIAQLVYNIVYKPTKMGKITSYDENSDRDSDGFGTSGVK